MTLDQVLQALHDDIAQDLFVAQSALVQLTESLPDDRPEGVLARLAQTAVQRALLHTCELVSGLRAAEDSAELDLAVALQRALIEIAVPMGIATAYRETGSGVCPEPRAYPAIVAIVREALSNVREHAAASEVLLSVHRDAAWTRIAVADNGRGFRPRDGDDATPHAGFGLVDMQQRARAVGGRIELASRPGAGVTVTLEVPARGS